eukprot:1841312-Prymnesium_polylepis.1
MAPPSPVEWQCRTVTLCRVWRPETSVQKAPQSVPSERLTRSGHRQIAQQSTQSEHAAASSKRE